MEETPHALIFELIHPPSIMLTDTSHGVLMTAFFGSKKPGLAKKISITGSHRYDLLNDIGRSIYRPEIESIQTIFGSFILYNDNLAVDHYI